MGSPVCYVGIDRMTPREPSRLNVVVETVARAEGRADQVVRVANLSSNGCMAEAGVPMPIGENVMLMLPGIGWVLTNIRWSLGGRFGGRFSDPISMDDFWRANPPFDASDARLFRSERPEE